MKRCRFFGLSVALASLMWTAVARADDPRSPAWALRLEPGALLMPDHLHDHGPGVGIPPALYIGASLERAVAGPVRVNVSGGASLLLGWLAGATVRYVALDRERLSVSLGAGPLLAPGAAFGAAVFAQADATAQLKLARAVVAVAGGSIGFALNRAGGPSCGIDTCEAYLARGDRVISLRAGVGYAF